MNSKVNSISIKNYSNFSATDKISLSIFWRLIIFIGLAIGAIYFTPGFIKTVFFISLLILFYFSKPSEDYFWIIIVLILVDNPGNIFWKTTESIIQISILKFSYLELFSITALIKVILRNAYPKISTFLKKPYKIYIVWFIFLLVEGVIIGIEGGGGTGYRYLWYYYRLFVILPLFYSIPRMLSYRDNIYKFCCLIFILAIANFGLQLLSIFLKQNLHFLLGGTASEYWSSIIYYSRSELIRPIFGVYINLFAFLTATYFYMDKNKKINDQYLLLIIIICYVSILLTAIRGWIIAYSFFLIFILLLFIKKKNLVTSIFKIVIVIIPFFLFFMGNMVMSKQINFVFEKLSTLNYFISGDITLDGKNIRLTDYHTSVMNKFYEKPITGWGFSGEGADNWDGHIGNQSILLIGGVIGYFIILYIWFHIFSKINQARKKSYGRKNSLKVLTLSLLTLIIIHSATAQIFGYFLYAHSESSALVLAIYLSIISILLNQKKGRNHY